MQSSLNRSLWMAINIFCITIVSAGNNYRIMAQWSDGSPMEENSIIRYDDKCVFTIVDEKGKAITFTNVDWTWEVYYRRLVTKDTLSLPFYTTRGNDTLKIDMTLLENKNKLPQSLTDFLFYRNENPDYIRYLYTALKCTGKTNMGTEINVTSVYYLDLLPPKPVFGYLKVEPCNDAPYGFFRIYGEAVKAERIDTFKAITYTEDAMVEWRVKNNRFDCSYLYEREEDYLRVYSYNKYGRKGCDPIYPFRYSALEKTEKEDIFFLHPNPARNILNIYLPEPDGKNFEINIFNTDGKCTLKKITGQRTFQIDISGFPEGMYSLVAKQNDRIRFYRKFIIVR